MRPSAGVRLPLAFVAHAGSLLARTGTPVNVIVSDAAAEAGVGRFGFFECALVGVPLVVGSIAIVVGLGERLLPGGRDARLGALVQQKPHTPRWRPAATSSCVGTSVLA